ncbi:DIE2/ALG10 family-domain-containing protein [Coemansia spiralis]|nr:DIE2/ALG10 family-domain-containing protein [Coemansia spiralis]
MPRRHLSTLASTSAVFCAYASASYAILRRINGIVSEPYMDEIFHVPQAQHYCKGDFGTWDPKLTTPPGLYLVSTISAYITSALGIADHEDACSFESLRSINWALGMLVFWAIFAIIRALRPTLSALETASAALTLSLFPLVFFFHHLYYTDTGSLLFVLLSFASSLHDRHVLAGTLGFLSLWFRQTNAVWVAFIGFGAALRRVQQRKGIGLQNEALKNTSHHQAVLHLPQLLYFYAYSTGMLAPIVLLLASPLHCNLVFNLFLCCVMAIGVNKYTIEHPFLLSDNRHYPFYIWKNVFRQHQLAKYVVIPTYIYAAFAIHHVLSKRATVLWRLALAVCTALVLVPSPLLEFRYFTIPFFFVRLHASSSTFTFRALAAETAWYMLINAATVWMFLNKPFVWKSEPDRLQRFMW